MPVPNGAVQKISHPFALGTCPAHPLPGEWITYPFTCLGNKCTMIDHLIIFKEKGNAEQDRGLYQGLRMWVWGEIILMAATMLLPTHGIP